MIRNIVPKKTWNPWKPVNEKNVEPKIFSCHENKTPYLYSNAWHIRKANPKIMVTTRCWVSSNLKNVWFFVANQCANVIVTPDVKSKYVLAKGKPQISKVCNPCGGQVHPITGEGTILL